MYHEQILAGLFGCLMAVDQLVELFHAFAFHVAHYLFTFITHHLKDLLHRHLFVVVKQQYLSVIFFQLVNERQHLLFSFMPENEMFCVFGCLFTAVIVDIFSVLCPASSLEFIAPEVTQDSIQQRFDAALASELPLSDQFDKSDQRFVEVIFCILLATAILPDKVSQTVEMCSVKVAYGGFQCCAIL